MKRSSLGLVVSGLLLMGSLLSSCGGGGDEAANVAQNVPAPSCPICPPPPPPPSPVPVLPSVSDILHGLEKKFKSNPESIQGAAQKEKIMDRLGQPEITAEEFPRFVSFFWALDPEFRILQLRAMVSTNRLVDMLKPEKGKFDINTPPKDIEAEDSSLLIGQVIVDWSLVQARLVDDFRSAQITNISDVAPGEDFPPAEAMMQELKALVTPPEPGLPEKTLQGAMLLLEGDAFAQTSFARPTAKPIAGKRSLAVVRVKTITAPLLLARTISYKVGDKPFVLQSPFMVAAPEFSATPAAQFQFKVEKMSVGPGYRDAVESKVNVLAEIQKRTIPEWWELAEGMTELRLVKQLVDETKIAPPESLPTPAMPTEPSTGMPPGAAPGTNPGMPPSGFPPSGPTTTAPGFPPAAVPPSMNGLPPSAPPPAMPPSPTGSGGVAPIQPATPTRDETKPLSSPTEATPSRPDSLGAMPAQPKPAEAARPDMPSGSLPPENKPATTMPAPAAPPADMKGPTSAQPIAPEMKGPAPMQPSVPDMKGPAPAPGAPAEVKP